jgi:hypothetical protein
LAALLGLLAIAGYQNRDKLAEMLRGAQAKSGEGLQSSVPASPTGRGGGDSSGASTIASGEMGDFGAFSASPS